MDLVGHLIHNQLLNQIKLLEYIMKKIERKVLKSIAGGDPLPEGWGICIVDGEYIPTPCNEYCPDKMKTQPFCAAPVPGQMS
ncbi:hypothetical protein BAX97_03770 [Elizabethkingia meningoseptica]|nr:hypothetical protein BBD33_16265 [Elizabethkingia meningoseptica]EOR28412.1 hypothetical protein L100_16475 [Elizabethkingia meningoseptica ATCC 13253 = NBRC 12535]AQX48762.1 hypothetical protein B5G46_16260 [Elizabethkingia meningoseptica]KUY14847.1 hypothetical protein ATB99_10080 [Elizabethkingia meningoseptica]MDE5466470.1 hypothetical protein [Elizabethkingia meningoseptica]